MADQLPRPRLSDRLALTVAEAAAALGVSERHLRAVLPEIPRVHLGRRVLIPVESLARWLRDQSRIEGDRAAAVADEIIRSFEDD